MVRAASDVELPVSLWDMIEAVYDPMALEKIPQKETRSSAKFEIPTEFIPIKLYLVEKNRGILNGTNYELVYGKGGGELDLQDFVSDRNGSFYVAMTVNLDLGEKPLRVFYLSNAKQRKIGGEEVGAGCDTYIDLTRYFAKAMKEKGILANTTRQQHISLLAGTYFFVASVGGRLYLSQLTIKDSRYRQLHCRR
jgi:hypothetical protein